METIFHLLGILCYTLGSVYYSIAIYLLLTKRNKQ